MPVFSHVARSVALAAALAFTGGAMAKSGPSEALQATNSATAATFAGALRAPTPLNVAGINSFEAIGEAANTVILLNVGANAQIVGVSWDVIISAFDPSYLSEMRVVFEASDQSDGVSLTVAPGDTFSGLNEAYSSGGMLALNALSFNVLADGILRIEFYERYDDEEVAPDGTWVSGNITFDVAAAPIPEPSTYGLMAVGLLGVAGAARRRRAD